MVLTIGLRLARALSKMPLTEARNELVFNIRREVEVTTHDQVNVFVRTNFASCNISKTIRKNM